MGPSCPIRLSQRSLQRSTYTAFVYRHRTSYFVEASAIGNGACVKGREGRGGQRGRGKGRGGGRESGGGGGSCSRSSRHVIGESWVS